MKVYFTIFAGRKRYLDCLFPYLQKCIAKNLIYEVHLWDYTHTSEDSDFLKEYSNMYPKFIYFKPILELLEWKEYYLYYSKADFEDDDIIIKCDDDIVYIDIEKMDDFLQSIDSTHIYIPNIINNDVCAYIQTNLGVANFINQDEIYSNYGKDSVPFTSWKNGWFRQFEKAKQCHELFLQYPEKFTITSPQIPWNGRFSINFFAGKFAFIHKLYSLFSSGNYNDEEFISFCGLRRLKTQSIIIPSFIVVHFSFRHQSPKELDELFLDSYHKLATT